MNLAPRFINTLSAPLRLLPTLAHSQALALVLNQVMKDAIAEGELDFLIGRTVGIEISDLGIRYRLGLAGGRIRGHGEGAPAAATISGGLHEFMLLAARREDADTLFFQRRLRMAGDTELGLYLKNFLDAFEPPPQVAPLIRGLDRLLGEEKHQPRRRNR
ncbi:ubiquinone anaerobic biosynthesis accessory factor UbiT [Candidatus Thiodictyon syntrophicum]|jgi:predicted lipid carrier protein YhbT|uniref:Ubiquinone biosynthesis accessory factor UbiT n=1 Tax=Candidatus Thiodictyon syntrophicum TaxID=1166950 RepID=A0A2K8U6W9_9GAMM|nr:SCP2 sterol-binding domain-containing protein [Candidatus Thiodictyon syntrophicum]AUB81287.1 sterol-binding protein [Candidatus Thiodictyon syntrophicum]